MSEFPIKYGVMAGVAVALLMSPLAYDSLRKEKTRHLMTTEIRKAGCYPMHFEEQINYNDGQATTIGFAACHVDNDRFEIRMFERRE